VPMPLPRFAVARHRSRPVWLVAALLGAGLLLTACSPSAPGQAAATPGALTLRVGDQKGGSQALLEASGQLRDTPYNVEFSSFAAAAPLLEALNANAIDLGGAGDAPVLFAQAAGTPLKVVQASRGNPAGTAIVVRADSPLQSAADLRGKTIATGKGSIGHFQALGALAQAGIPVSDVTLAFLTPADAKAALVSGTADAWSTWEPYTSLAVMSDGWRVLVPGTGISSGLGFQVASESAVADKHAAIADYLQRLTRARRWALDNADTYVKGYAKLIEIPEPVARAVFTTQATHSVPIDDQVIADQQHTADVYFQAGVIGHAVSVAPVFDPSFNSASQV
jgi:sulfonate transport system substrate-binding protein